MWIYPSVTHIKCSAKVFLPIVTRDDLITELWAPEPGVPMTLAQVSCTGNTSCETWLPCAPCSAALVCFSGDIFAKSILPHTTEGCLWESHILNHTHSASLNTGQGEHLFCWLDILNISSTPILNLCGGWWTFQDIVKLLFEKHPTSAHTSWVWRVPMAKHSPNILWVRPLCQFFSKISALNLDCTEWTSTLNLSWLSNAL